MYDNKSEGRELREGSNGRYAAPSETQGTAFLNMLFYTERKHVSMSGLTIGSY
jgi:hypothetical protein